jgi:hypothetical protein
VALTRAQHKLIVLGNRAVLEDIPLLQRLVAYCASLYDDQGGIIRARPEGSASQGAVRPIGSRR